MIMQVSWQILPAMLLPMDELECFRTVRSLDDAVRELIQASAEQPANQEPLSQQAGRFDEAKKRWKFARNARSKHIRNCPECSDLFSS